MKTLKWLVVFSILGVSAHAQDSGFFVSAGGGVASIKVDDFAVFNPIASVPGEPRGEALKANGENSSVVTSHLGLGIHINENWDFQVNYTVYGAGEVSLAFPQYPGIFWAAIVGVGPSSYQRHVLKYKTTAYAFVPTYAKELGKNLRVRAGIGINYATTDSHIEATYRAGTAIFPPPSPQSYSYAETSYKHLGYIISLGVEYRIFEKFTAEIKGNYATSKLRIPTTPWANRTKSQVNIDALGVELALLWHW